MTNAAPPTGAQASSALLPADNPPGGAQPVMGGMKALAADHPFALLAGGLAVGVLLAATLARTSKSASPQPPSPCPPASAEDVPLTDQPLTDQPVPDPGENRCGVIMDQALAVLRSIGGEARAYTGKLGRLPDRAGESSRTLWPDVLALALRLMSHRRG